MKRFKKNTVVLCIFLALFFSSFSDFAQAKADLSVKAEDFKKRAIKYRKKGYKIQQSGDFNKAMSFYQKAVFFDPGYAVAYNDIGVIHEMRGLLDSAEENYLMAIDLNPKYLPSLTNLAYLYEKKADVEKAAYYWMQRISLGDPTDPWTEKAWDNFRSLSFLSDETREKFIKFQGKYLSRQVIRKKMYDFENHIVRSKEFFKKGKTLLLEKNYAAARRAFEAALFFNPDNPDVKRFYEMAKAKENMQIIDNYASKGKRLYEAGDAQAARKEFDRILSILPRQSNQR